MAFIDWNDNLSVSIAEIDTQHKKLVDMINTLNEAMKQRKSKEVLGDIVNGLVDYAVEHFSTEEKYFEKFQYPATHSHKKEHDAFVSKVTDVQQAYKEGRLMLSIDIMDFLKNWLVNHIQGTDKKYVAFFNEKGLT